MKQLALPLLAAVLVLAACGGAGNAPANTQKTPTRQSRLSAFDPGKLAEGLQFPDFTDYWKLAELRNGNTFPVKVAANDDNVMNVRLGADGNFARFRDGRFDAQMLTGISSSMQQLAKAHWDEHRQATTAIMILFADRRAPWTALLKLCRELVDLQVRNLLLVTHDRRDDALRLLPLKVDTEQVFNEWYNLPAKQAVHTLRYSRGAKNTAALAWASAPDKTAAYKGKEWRGDLAKALPKYAKNATRVQFDLPDDAKVDDFAGAANLLAPVGYADVEPWWPSLARKPVEHAVVPQRRKLAVFDDKLGLTKDLSPPTLSEYWRASAADRGLPAAAVIDPKLPLLAVRVDAEGKYATRTRNAKEWTSHADDQEVVEAMQQQSGEVDFDKGSDLQVLLCIDRDARWDTFLAVLEMMRSATCRRLLVVTSDVLGPTLRLLDLSLPRSKLADDARLAAVNVDRVGPQADADYRVEMLLDGAKRKTEGGGFTSTLARWATQRKQDPEVLAIKLPRDETVQTCFNILNALSELGMHSVRIGG